MQMQGLSMEQYLEIARQNIEKMREQMEEGARKSVKGDLILNEIRKVENIEVTPEEIEGEIEMTAAMYGMDKNAIVEDLRKSGNYENFVDNATYQIARRKAVEFVVDLAKKIKTIDWEVFMYNPVVNENDGEKEKVYDIYSRLLKDRIIFVSGEVEDNMANAIVAQLLFLDAQDKERI